MIKMMEYYETKLQEYEDDLQRYENELDYVIYFIEFVLSDIISTMEQISGVSYKNQTFCAKDNKRVEIVNNCINKHEIVHLNSIGDKYKNDMLFKCEYKNAFEFLSCRVPLYNLVNVLEKNIFDMNRIINRHKRTKRYYEGIGKYEEESEDLCNLFTV